MTFENQLREAYSKSINDYFESIKDIRKRTDLTFTEQLEKIHQLKTTSSKRLLELPDFQKLQQLINSGLIPPGLLSYLSPEFLEWISGTPEEHIQEVTL